MLIKRGRLRPFDGTITGADPFADLVGDAFLAGVLVAVRFTGSSVAGLAFVAATYSLSVVRFSAHARAQPKSVGYVDVGVDLNSGCFAALGVGGRRRPL